MKRWVPRIIFVALSLTYASAAASIIRDQIVHGRYWLAAASSATALLSIVLPIVAGLAINAYGRYREWRGWFNGHNELWAMVVKTGGNVAPLLAMRLGTHRMAISRGLHKCDDPEECSFTASVRTSLRARDKEGAVEQ